MACVYFSVCLRALLLQHSCWSSRPYLWSHKGPVNVWLTDNCQRSMGRIKMELRTERTLTCWHVLLSAFQGGFSLFALLWRDRRDNYWIGLTAEAVGELWSRRLGQDCLHSQGEGGYRSREGSGVSESLSLTKQTQWNFCHCWCRGLSDRAA